MKINVQFQGSSKHFSNPNAINASFASQDGTTANLNIAFKAEEELVLGGMYEIHIIPVQPIQSLPIDAAAIVTDFPALDEHKKQLMEENNS